MEDKYLYEYAKQELMKIAAEKKPFNFTILTVDTHHTDGYICELCDDEYPERFTNVICNHTLPNILIMTRWKNNPIIHCRIFNSLI